MANTIQLKRSSTASDTPSASDLAVGELAVNTADAKLFTKHTDNSIKEISGSGGGSGLSNVVEDTTPQLGGNLDANANNIDLNGGAITDSDDDTVEIDAGLRIDPPGGSVQAAAIIDETSARFFRDVVINGTNDDLIFDKGTYTTTLSSANPAAQNQTVTLPDATGTVQLTDGSGASLTSLNASELSSGTVPNARLDQQLQDVAGLAVTNGGFIVGDGSNFVLETGATARTSIGVGSIATQAADSVNIDGGAIDGVTLGTNSAVTEARIADVLFPSGTSTIDADNTLHGLILKANGQFVARVQSSSQNKGGGLYFYQNNGYITFEGTSPDAHETNLKVTDPTADRDITLPDATGTVALDESTGMTLNNGVIALKNGGTQSEVRLYCESSNAHYAGLKAPAHADFSGNVTSTLPSVTGTLIGTANADAPATTTSSSDADHVLINDGGVLKKITPTNLGIGGGGGSSLTIQDEGSALSTAATTLNFVGAGVVASGTGATKTITIGETSNADTVDNKHVSVLSQSAYDALTPDSNTIYFITG